MNPDLFTLNTILKNLSLIVVNNHLLWSSKEHTRRTVRTVRWPLRSAITESSGATFGTVVEFVVECL